MIRDALQLLPAVMTIAGIVLGGWLAQRSNRRAAHWRDVEARQRREREAANAPVFCAHCSALIPKTAGVVRFCQRCGKPPGGSALTLTAGRTLHLKPGWSFEQVQPVKPPRQRPQIVSRQFGMEIALMPCGACGKDDWELLAGNVYVCRSCGNTIRVPASGG